MRLTPLEWGLRAPITPRLGGNCWGATAPWQNRSGMKKNKPALNTKLRILPSTLLDLRKERLAESEHGEDIDVIRSLKLTIRNVLEFFIGSLEGGVVYKNVDRPECVDGFPGHGLADGRLANVAGKKHGPSTGFSNKAFGLSSVLLFG